MSLTHVQGYLASDGRFFFKEDKADAEAYECQLQFKAWCSENICIGGEWDSRMVANRILEDWAIVPKRSV